MSEQAGRYQRSAGGLVGSLVVLVALLLAWVGFRALTTDHPDSAVRVVDYRPVVEPARRAADFDLLAPPSLPSGWRATSVCFTDTEPQHWHLGVLTGEDRYVGLEQGAQGPRTFVEQYVDEEATRTGSVDVAGAPWSTYTDAQGDLALVRRDGGTTTLVVGHDVPRSTLVGYAAGLR